VWDSNAQAEWDECITKRQFLLTRTPATFELFETILWDTRRLVYWREHIERLKKSALFFNITYAQKEIRALKQQIQKRVSTKQRQRVRIFLNSNGVWHWDARVLQKKNKPSTNRIALSTHAVDRHNIFLFHKTTHRPWYEKAMREIRKRNVYDIIFVNQEQEITEGARTNIFVTIKGKLHTPPLQCGLLPGILRAKLLRQGKCSERTLTIKDIRNAEALYCGNSVRGLMRVCLQG